MDTNKEAKPQGENNGILPFKPISTVASQTLERELQWASDYIQQKCTFMGDQGSISIQPPLGLLLDNPAPKIEGDCSYALLINQLLADWIGDSLPQWFHTAERLVLALAIMQHLYPEGLSPLADLTAKERWKRVIAPCPSMHSFSFIPSVETALFLIAGEDVQLRREALQIFDKDHLFARLGILHFPQPPAPALHTAAPIQLGDEYYSLLVAGKPYRPGFSSAFGAQLLEVRESWEDFVALEGTIFALEDIKMWLKQRKEMDKDPEISKRSRKGYRALFYGPSGTGKTMSAGLIGKEASLPVYRVDLSAVVSKYIGETEKNLEAIFKKAEHKDWILFFDEADALFGKRTQASTANDRYANQEVSYLLQRIEDFDGLVILSSNLKVNMDNAFTRRFQNIVKFTSPDESMRKTLFLSAFKGRFALQEDKVLDEVCSKKHAFTGAEINNIFRYCAMRVLNSGEKGVSPAVFNNGVVTELKKKGKLP